MDPPSSWLPIEGMMGEWSPSPSQMVNQTSYSLGSSVPQRSPLKSVNAGFVTFASLTIFLNSVGLSRESPIAQKCRFVALVGPVVRVRSGLQPAVASPQW